MVGGSNTDSLRVNFIHPDLGIGGAERLVVDAAVGLQNRGHRVTMYTAHHDPAHCFDETQSRQRNVDEGTIEVVVVGDWLPRSVFGRGMALWAYVRMLYVALYMVCFAPAADVVFCDSISVAVLVFRWFSRARVFFYCHFPDSRLCVDRGSLFKRLYRMPIDAVEQYSTARAHVVVVNSGFTQSVFAETFTRINGVPGVLYPPINTQAIDTALAGVRDPPPHNRRVVLSINRFERKKEIGLAVEAYRELRDRMPAKAFNKLQLVLIGGYDERVTENVEHVEELCDAVTEAGLSFAVLRSEEEQRAGSTAQVVFILSAPIDVKWRYLRHCEAVVYTPSQEHFGIVPIEAMFASRPVVAVNSGGPTESIIPVDVSRPVSATATGFLCPPEPELFAAALDTILSDSAMANQMGSAGRRRVQNVFSLDAFAERLEALLRGTLALPANSAPAAWAVVCAEQ